MFRIINKRIFLNLFGYSETPSKFTPRPGVGFCFGITLKYEGDPDLNINVFQYLGDPCYKLVIHRGYTVCEVTLVGSNLTAEHAVTIAEQLEAELISYEHNTITRYGVPTRPEETYEYMVM